MNWLERAENASNWTYKRLDPSERDDGVPHFENARESAHGLLSPAEWLWPAPALAPQPVAGPPFRLIRLDGKWRLTLEIDENTNAEQIRTALVGSLPKWRQALLKLRKTEVPALVIRTEEQAHRLLQKQRADGMTWPAVAQSVNDEVAALLGQAYSFTVSFEGLTAVEKSDLIAGLLPNANACLAIRRAMDFMRALRFKDDEESIEACLEAGLSRLAEGKAAFELARPFDEERIRRFERTFNERGAKKKL